MVRDRCLKFSLGGDPSVYLGPKFGLFVESILKVDRRYLGSISITISNDDLSKKLDHLSNKNKCCSCRVIKLFEIVNMNTVGEN